MSFREVSNKIYEVVGKHPSKFSRGLTEDLYDIMDRLVWDEKVIPYGVLDLKLIIVDTEDNVMPLLRGEKNV